MTELGAWGWTKFAIFITLLIAFIALFVFCIYCEIRDYLKEREDGHSGVSGRASNFHAVRSCGLHDNQGVSYETLDGQDGQVL